jgi:alkylation response protein AidB-like acyl-CoA dehydrogenase
MNFLYDDEQVALAESTRMLIERRRASVTVRDLMHSGTGLDPLAWREGAGLGWFSMLVPESSGGGSLTAQGLVDLTALAEQWGRSLQSGPLISTNVAAAALAHAGSPAQQTLVPGLVSGGTTVAWCVAEEAAEWNATRTGLAATADGRGLTLSGTKILVESADLAEHLVVTARLEGTVVELLVPAGAPGVTIEAHRTLDLTRRYHAVSFDRTPVGRNALLPGADLAGIEAQIDTAAVLACADSVGGAERVLEMTVAYAGDRVQFGRRIASFQAVKHRCADLLVAVEGARAATRYAAMTLADGDQAAAGAVDVAKAHVGDACATVTGEAIQLHGGVGFTWDVDVHLYARRAKANEVLFGSPAWRRARTWQRLTADRPDVASREV